MKLKLSYFYATGIYRSDADYESDFDPNDPKFEACIAKEIQKLRNRSALPQAPKTAEIIVLITYPDNPELDPRILPLSDGAGVAFGDNAHNNLTNTGTVVGDFIVGDKDGKRGKR